LIARRWLAKFLEEAAKFTNVGRFSRGNLTLTHLFEEKAEGVRGPVEEVRISVQARLVESRSVALGGLSFPPSRLSLPCPKLAGECEESCDNTTGDHSTCSDERSR
jgi:hypothetical protein